VETVLDFLRPTTREYGEGAVQAFLGLLNYRRFGQGIAKVLRPLMAALHGDKSALDEVPWSPGMDAAFSSSKKALDFPLLLYMIACEINCHIFCIPTYLGAVQCHRVRFNCLITADIL
jgi:hypothetical protein